MKENSSAHDAVLPFGALDIPESLKLGIKELGYTSPTPFQQGVFEHVKNGRSVVCLGQSTYGKSLAYSLPILAKINPRCAELQALIVCDNKAQAEACAQECKALSRHLGVNIELGSQLEPGINIGPQILICSAADMDFWPQTLVSEAKLNTIFFDNLSALNAQRIINILSTCLLSGEVQILIFGNETINAINAIENSEHSEEVLKKMAFIDNSDQPTIAQSAKHFAHIASETEPKPRALLAALEFHKPKNALISCNEASECDLLARFLSRYGFRAFVCEENNTQALTNALAELERHNFDIVLCPNNMLDKALLETVAFMINYDLIDRPQSYEQATQFNKQAPKLERIIVNLLSAREISSLTPLKSQCLIDIELVELPSSEEVLKLSAKRLGAQLKDEASLVELGQFESLAHKLIEQEEILPVLAFLLRNHFLKSAPAPQAPQAARRHERFERFERNDKNRRPNMSQGRLEKFERNSEKNLEKNLDRNLDRNLDKDEQPPAPARAFSAPEGSTRLYVTLGRHDGLADLASLAQFLSTGSGVDLGHFSGSGMVRDRSAHIEVDDGVAQAIIDAMHNSKRPLSDNDNNIEAAPVICERARQNNERPHRAPMRRNHSYQQRRR